MQGHPDQYPETQLVKTSHSSIPAHSSLVIYVCSQNSFLLDISVLYPMPRKSSSSYNTHTVLSNKSFSSIKDLATMPTANGMEARAMPHNIMPVTCTLAGKQGSLILNLQT